SADTDPGSDNVKAADRLHAELFMNYDNNVQPQFDGVPTTVRLGLKISYLDIDEMNGMLTVHSWMNIRWRDELRAWRPLQYDNITEIQLRPDEVWKPDIALMNGADGGMFGHAIVILRHDGSFQWVPPGIYSAYCNLNMLNWPYDQQTCKLKIGSWGLQKIEAETNFTSKDNKPSAVDLEDMVQSTEWEIVDAKAQYVSQDYRGYVEFSLTAQRQASMYTGIIYTPASCLVILALSAFWLPPHMGGEKIMINGLLIIVIAAFLMYFAQLLPVLANRTPLVVIFYSIALMLVSGSTIIEVIVLYLATAKHKRRVPEFLRRLLHGKMGTWLLLSHFIVTPDTQKEKTKEMDEHLQENGNSNEEDDDMTNPLDINSSEVPAFRAIQFDWALLATAVDRICFLLFALTFMILAIVCAV
ncbi:hypothetical protein KR018_007993, partial [Drosophila ironensis]